MRIVIIEDQRLLSSTLIQALEQEASIEIVGHSEKASDVLQLCQEQTPDLIIMDVFTQDGNGIEYTARVKTQFPQIKVMVITGIEDDRLVEAAQAAGADLFVRKNVSLPELVDFIRYANKPYRIFPETAPAVHEPALLSAVDVQIISLLARGLSAREIADILFISYGTVRLYISRMYAATGTKSRAQLVAHALRSGLIEPA